MTNIELALDSQKNMLTIQIDISETHGPSKSGKTIVVASSRGNKQIEGTDCFLGLNVYKYPEQEE